MGTASQSSASSSISASNDASASHVRRHPGSKTDGSGSQGVEEESIRDNISPAPRDIRRQQSAAERALSGFASALGGGNI